jgi:hypothetical protein
MLSYVMEGGLLNDLTGGRFIPKINICTPAAAALSCHYNSNQSPCPYFHLIAVLIDEGVRVHPAY